MTSDEKRENELSKIQILYMKSKPGGIVCTDIADSCKM